MVLLGAVVALVVVALLAHGALLLARFEAAASRASLAILQARAAAEAGLVALEGPAGAATVAVDSVPVGGDRLAAAAALPTGRYEVHLVRAARESWLAEARGWDGSDRVRVDEARALWRLDPPSRLAAWGAVVRVGSGAGAVGVPAVDGGAPRALRSPLDGAACSTWLTDPAVPLPPRLPAFAPVEAPGGGAPGLGLLDQAALDALLPVLPAAAGTPGPVRTPGGCGAGPWNWGDPDDPGGPCGGRFVGARAPGDLVVDGGRGQGLLVVRGDVHLASGTRFVGVVLAGGWIRLGPGAVLEGLAATREGVVVEGDARVTGSFCAAGRALHGVPALRAFRVVPGGRRLGPAGRLP